jgi:hypothetical protein
VLAPRGVRKAEVISIKRVDFIIGVVALIASATFWLVYMGSAIAYGSLVGLKGCEPDLQADFTGMVGLAAAAVFQVTAWVISHGIIWER